MKTSADPIMNASKTSHQTDCYLKGHIFKIRHLDITSDQMLHPNKTNKPKCILKWLTYCFDNGKHSIYEKEIPNLCNITLYKQDKYSIIYHSNNVLSILSKTSKINSINYALIAI